MAEDADDGEEHAGEVAVGVAYKNFGRVPIVAAEGAGNAEEREQEVDGEEVRVRCWVGVVGYGERRKETRCR